MIDGPTKDRGERTNKAFATIRRKFDVLRSVLDERGQRWWAGSEAEAHGRGGVTLVHEATGMRALGSRGSPSTDGAAG